MNLTSIRQTVQRVRQQAKPWVIVLARAGYAAKGIVFLLIGLIALRGALAPQAQAMGSRGALQMLALHPVGKLLLGVIGVGLCGYALWRLVQAALDPGEEGEDAKGIAKRLGYAASGLSYGALALTTLDIILGESGEGAHWTDWTATLMAMPPGRWLIGVGGVAFVAVALYAGRIAWRADFCDEFNLDELNPAQLAWISHLGRAGYAARGVIFALIGWFLMQAAWHARPGASGGLDKALQTLAQQPQGHWLMGLVAAGVTAYGIYVLAQARYSRIYDG